MSPSLKLYSVSNCPADSAHGLWRELLERRLDKLDYEYDIPGNKLRIWNLKTQAQRTPQQNVTYRDGIEFTRVSMGRDCADTVVGLNFCRLFFEDDKKYPSYLSHAELFEAGKTPPILQHIPLLRGIEPFINVLNGESPILSPTTGLNYTPLAEALELKFKHTTVTANSLSTGNYASNILKHLRGKAACITAKIDLALVLPFTKQPDKAKKIANETAKVLISEWKGRMVSASIQTVEDFDSWIDSSREGYTKLAFFALDTQKGERPHSTTVAWMKTLEEHNIGYSLFNSGSNPIYTRHGNAQHILAKAGGYHYSVTPTSVPDLADHWCIGLDLGVGAQYKGKVAVMALTDGKGQLIAYWRAIKDADETLTHEILQEGLSYLIEHAEAISPGQNFIVLRDGRCPKNEPIELYKEILPEGRSTFIEYVKKGNPLMELQMNQPDAATLCTVENSTDSFLFTAKAPQRDCLTNTVKFFSRHNELGYSQHQLGEILSALCFAPKLSFQPSSLPAPIYYADGIASVSYTNLQFGGWSHLPNTTRDFRPIAD